MESIGKALQLLRRQAELEDAMRRPGGIRVTEERELNRLRMELQGYPAAVRAILETATRLDCPLGSLSVGDLKTI
jgi:hypothetical protein